VNVIIPVGPILVTGAGGHLGRLVAEALAADGRSMRLLDRPESLQGGGPGERLAGDIADQETCGRAVEGAAGVVHLAALHGIHLFDQPPEAFWRTNVDGTFALLRAAAAARVPWLVFASSIGVYGDAEGWLDEGVCGHPIDVYQLTKVVGEDLVRFAGTQWGMRTVSLRLGIFVPTPPDNERRRLLAGGVRVTDAATAVVLAARRLSTGGDLPRAINVVARVPFTADDLPALDAEPAAVLERHWPGIGAAFSARGSVPPRVTRIYPTETLRASLGWRPKAERPILLEPPSVPG